MISESTTIVKFETLANNAASKLNELLIIIEDLTLAPKSPPTGFDFDFINLIETKYPGDEPYFKAAKQYYYFFGLLQRFCHTLFYNTKEPVAFQKLISTHLITYLLAFDAHPLAYQAFFLDTLLGQNILHFCLIAFNQPNLWQNFLPRMKDSPYYLGLNFCKTLLTQASYNEEIPPINLIDDGKTTTTSQYTTSTKALIQYVISAKFAVMPSTLSVTPENIHAGAECYHRCFTLLTRGAALSRNFCFIPFLIPLINKYRCEIVFNFHMRYREEAFVNDPRFIPALRNLAINILQTMQPAQWLKLTLTEITSITDIFTLKKHHTVDEAAQLYALIDPLILTLCRHKLFTRAYELMDTLVAILSLMKFKAEDKQLANAKLAPLAFMSKFHNICIETTYQLPEFSEPQKELFTLMSSTPPPKNYAEVLSPLAETSFSTIINIDSYAINDIRRYIVVMRFLKLALPLFSNPTSLKSKIKQLQEAMIATFFNLLTQNKFSEALNGYQSMIQTPNCVEDIDYFKLKPIWPAIIKICQAIQDSLEYQKPITIDAFKDEIKHLKKPFEQNNDLSKKFDDLLVSLLMKVAIAHITDNIKPNEHYALINLLNIFKLLLSAQSYARLQKQFKVNAYTDNLTLRLFPPVKTNEPVTTPISNKISIPDGVYQSLLSLATAINCPLVLTGAAVFELLHQKTPHDYDVLVFGPNMDDLTLKLNNSGINFSRIGKTVEIIQIELPTGEIIELSAIEAQDTSTEALTVLEQQQFNKRDLRLSSLFVLINQNNKSQVITSFNCALQGNRVLN